MDEANENYRKGGNAPTYKDPDKLTLEIHYGGTLMQVAVGKGDEYCGVEVVFLDNIDGDKLSWIELIRIAKEIGYTGENICFYYKFPRDKDYKLIDNDENVLQMVAERPNSKIIPLYVVSFDVALYELSWQGQHGDLLSETASGTYKEAEGQKGEYEGQNKGQDGNGTKNGKVNMQEEREKAGNASENEESDEEDDTKFIDSDYEQDTDAEEVEVDDTMFEECIDNPIEEEPEEMGYAGEISNDVQNSEDLHSKQDNDDECDENGEVTSNRRKRNVPNFRKWRREAMLKNPTFDIGMHFANKTVFKEAMQHYTCMVRKNIWFKKDDKQRVKAACKVGCPFVIFASRIDDSPTMVIKTLNLEHECSRDQRNYWLNSIFFAPN